MFIIAAVNTPEGETEPDAFLVWRHPGSGSGWETDKKNALKFNTKEEALEIKDKVQCWDYTIVLLEEP